jgi:CDP-diacylglycerol--serine O-phosphatidyltransferase
MNIKKHIPNSITCGNLLCGCLAIVEAFRGNLVTSTYFVGIAAILDFFDGFTARLLNVHSEIGKQLDSLADMVTFGVVPGVIVFKLMSIYLVCGVNQEYEFYLPYIAFLIPIFSALRLAKFNVDTRQSSSFIGVPTPANAILICSLPLIAEMQPVFMGLNLQPLIYSTYFLIGLSVLMSWLMIAELPLFALKFKNFGWADNKVRYSFIIMAVILLLLLKFIAIPLIIFLYVILSMINREEVS